MKSIAMNKLLVNVTDELRACIDYLAKKHGKTIGTMTEDLLRPNPEVTEALATLGLSWQPRTLRGERVTPRNKPPKKSPKKKRTK